MKKTIALLLLCAMLLSCFAGCGVKQGSITLSDYAQNSSSQPMSGAGENTGATLTYDANWKTGASKYDSSVTDTSLDADTDGVLMITNAAELIHYVTATKTVSGDKVTNYYTGTQVKLTTNIDLDGMTWTAPVLTAAAQFLFDGQGYTIGNFKMDIDGTSVANHSFFGWASAGSTVENLALVDGTFTNKLTTGDSTVLGGIFSEVSSGATVTTLDNVYVKCNFVVDDSVTKKLSMVGGLIGKIKGAGYVTIQNCTFAGSIENTSTENGGIVGRINDAVKKLTMINCENEGTVKGTGYCGGMLGALPVRAATAGGYGAQYKAQTSTFQNVSCEGVELTGCVNSGTVESSGSYAGGMLSRFDCDPVATTAALVITGCSSTGTVTGGTCTGGIIGSIGNVPGKVKITDCSVSGVLTVGGTSGGIVGNTTGTCASSFAIDGCTVSATINMKGNQIGGIIGNPGGSSSTGSFTKGLDINECTFSGIMRPNGDTVPLIIGGIIGWQKAPSAINISNCTVSGDITAGRYTGGLVGSHVSNTLNISFSRVTADSYITVTLNSSSAAAGGILGNQGGSGAVLSNVSFDGTLDAICTSTSMTPSVGALLGRKEANCTLNVNHCHMGGKLIKNANSSVASVFAAGVACYNSGKVNYNQFTFDTVCEGDTLISSCDSAPMVPYNVGYQTRNNGNGTYDLRYVFAINHTDLSSFDKMGFKVALKYLGSDNQYQTYTTNAYATTVYETIMGQGKTYTASDFNGADYLCALVIQNVPAKYVSENNLTNLEIVVESSFVDADNKVLLTGNLMTHGDIVNDPTEFDVPKPDGAVTYDASVHDTSYVLALENADQADLTAYEAKLTGYTLAKSWETAITYSAFDTVNTGTGLQNFYRIYTKDNTMLYVYLCEGTKTLRVVVADIAEYHSYLRAQETANSQGDFEFAMVNLGRIDTDDTNGSETDRGGLSLVIQIADGRFIIVDGSHQGNATTAEIERLYNWMDARTEGNIEIAAWLFTHVHGDHTTLALEFAKQYGHLVTIGNYMYNFPTNAYVWENEPKFDLDYQLYGRVFDNLANRNALYNTLVPHTGMSYQFANCKIDILYTHEDFYPHPLAYYNNSSTCYKFTLTDANGGTTTFLVAGDMQEDGQDDLVAQVGDLLTSDYVQVTHHGHNGTKLFYQYCTGNGVGSALWPLNEYEEYTAKTPIEGYAGKIVIKNFYSQTYPDSTSEGSKWLYETSTVKKYLAFDGSFVIDQNDIKMIPGTGYLPSAETDPIDRQTSVLRDAPAAE